MFLHNFNVIQPVASCYCQSLWNLTSLGYYPALMVIKLTHALRLVGTEIGSPWREAEDLSDPGEGLPQCVVEVQAEVAEAEVEEEPQQKTRVSKI